MAKKSSSAKKASKNGKGPVASKKFSKPSAAAPNDEHGGEGNSCTVHTGVDGNLRAKGQCYQIELRLFSSERTPPVFRIIRRICSDKADYPMVVSWNYIVSKRLRLASSPKGDNLDDVEKLVADYLGDNKLEETAEEFIRSLASAEVIEISIPYETEKIGWAARLFPWENALSLVTRRFRNTQMVVLRHLDVKDGGGKPESKMSYKGKIMVIRSTPGDVGRTNNFRSEMELVKFKLNGTEANFIDVDTPTRQEALTKILEKKPALIHLSVIEAQAIEAEGRRAQKSAEVTIDATDHGDETQRDGIVLAGIRRPTEVLDPIETGLLVTGNGSYSPELVSFASCHSAARTAPMAVASGAKAAIGFHEQLTDAVSAAFFGTFYETWETEDWDLLTAFKSALKVMFGQPESGRSGVALWSAISLVIGRQAANLERKRSPAVRSARAIMPVPKMITLDESNITSIFAVNCEPLTKVNYCALHNGRDLFRQLSITKIMPGMTPVVETKVELTAENETAVWRESVRFGAAPGTVSLNSKVRVPLGSRALRRVQESVRSNLFVEIRCDGHILWQRSSQVTLVPVDEWRDTDEDRRWLPSFVLPRDPAVRRVIAAADRYLRALCDDSAAGFDGYQRVSQWPEVVDLQVRAIWCALLYDFGLRYINPPPTYSKTDNGIAQRLRVPTQVLEEGRGTCIDLALLMCACLEYVGIYPVIFLISGHAFPGWWRNEEAYMSNSFEEVKDAGSVPANEAEAAKEMAHGIDPYARWMVTGQMGFRELVKPLREGSLAAVESTMLCTSGSFDAALQQGRDNLADPLIFDAMVDVQKARDGDRNGENIVTPLPMIGSPMASIHVSERDQ